MPAVTQLDHPPQGAGSVAADQDGDCLPRGLREAPDLVERDELPLVGCPLLAPALFHDPDGLVTKCPALGEGPPEGRDLFLHPAHAHPQDQPSAREMIQGGEHLRRENRVAVGEDEDRGPQLDPFGDPGDQRECGQWLKEVCRGGERELAGVAVRVARADRVGDDDVVADPEGVVPERLHPLGEGDDVPARGDGTERGQVAPEFHEPYSLWRPVAWSTRSPSSPSTIIWTRRECWILPLEVFGMVWGFTRSTRAGRCPRLR